MSKLESGLERLQESTKQAIEMSWAELGRVRAESMDLLEKNKQLKDEIEQLKRQKQQCDCSSKTVSSLSGLANVYGEDGNLDCSGWRLKRGSFLFRRRSSSCSSPSKYELSMLRRSSNHSVQSNGRRSSTRMSSCSVKTEEGSEAVRGNFKVSKMLLNASKTLRRQSTFTYKKRNFFICQECLVLRNASKITACALCEMSASLEELKTKLQLRNEEVASLEKIMVMQRKQINSAQLDLEELSKDKDQEMIDLRNQVANFTAMLNGKKKKELNTVVLLREKITAKEREASKLVAIVKQQKNYIGSLSLELQKHGSGSFLGDSSKSTTASSAGSSCPH